jgi:hypothetical protein
VQPWNTPCRRVQVAALSRCEVATGTVPRALGYEAGSMSLSTDTAAVHASVTHLADALLTAVRECATARYRRMQLSSMGADVGWQGPAESWQSLIEEVARGDRRDGATGRA